MDSCNPPSSIFYFSLLVKHLELYLNIEYQILNISLLFSIFPISQPWWFIFQGHGHSLLLFSFKVANTCPDQQPIPGVTINAGCCPGPGVAESKRKQWQLLSVAEAYCHEPLY